MKGLPEKLWEKFWFEKSGHTQTQTEGRQNGREPGKITATALNRSSTINMLSFWKDDNMFLCMKLANDTRRYITSTIIWSSNDIIMYVKNDCD